MTDEEQLEKLENDLSRAKRQSRLVPVETASIVVAVFAPGAGGDARHEEPMWLHR